MRDPLGTISVRYKLALTFVGVCLLAFGVGGYLVSRSARATLEHEILGRLRFQAEAYGMAFEGDLRALVQRARDFASDGYIRAQFEAWADGVGGEVAPGVGGPQALRDHLVRNKLPLVTAFENLALVTPGGELFVARPEDAGWAGRARAAAELEREWFSGLMQAERGAGPPMLVIATPLRSLDSSRHLGSLLAKVHTGVWISEALAAMSPGSDPTLPEPALRLVDGAGRSLAIPRAFLERPAPRADGELVRSGFGLHVEEPGEAERARAPARGVFTRRIPITTLGWSLSTEIESRDALAAVSGLQARFLLVGLALSAAASVLLLFPMRFLAGPLRRLEAAARQISAGDFSARVPVESRDEIGALSDSFNLMAQAVEEHAHELEATSRALGQRKEELRKERDRLNAVILSMRDGLIVLDADGKPLFWNAAARPLVEIVSGDGGQLEPHRLCQAGPAEKEPSSPLNGDLEAAEESSSACQRCLFDPTGPPRSCLVDAGSSVYEVHSTRLASEADGRFGRVLVARDVTGRIAQDEREIHQERLSVLGEVAAVVAHELNNPLAAIRMFARMLGENLPPGSPLCEDVAVIERNTQACSRTIRDLLDFATGASPEVGPVDVHTTLEDVARFLRALRERKESELSLELVAEDSHVVGDEVQIRQVFVNLILNALQAVESGGHVRVRTWLDGGNLVVDVVDDGPGIPADMREVVFRPFYTTKQRGEGTGLGLSTARRITEIQGGGLELLESGPEGTVFRVRLLRGRA